MGRPTNGMGVGYPSTCFPHLQKLFPRCSRYLHPPNTKFKMNHQTAKKKNRFGCDFSYWSWSFLVGSMSNWGLSLVNLQHQPFVKLPLAAASSSSKRSPRNSSRWKISSSCRAAHRILRADFSKGTSGWPKILISMGVPRKYLGGFKKKTIAITVQWILTLYSNW